MDKIKIESIEKRIHHLEKKEKIDKHIALRIARQMPRGREETVSGRSGN